MKYRRRRNPAGNLSPELRSMRDEAYRLSTQARIFRLGVAAVLADGSVDAEELEACSSLLVSALAYQQESDTLRRTVRKAQDEAEEAEEAALRAGGDVQ